MSEQDTKAVIDVAQEAIRNRLEVRRAPADPKGLQNPCPFIVLRDATGNERVEWLQNSSPPPSRPVGTIEARSLESFLYLLGKLKTMDTEVYGTANPARFEAVINDHPAASASLSRGIGYRDFRVAYPIALSREWRGWLERNGRDRAFKSGEDFALFLEQRASQIEEPAAAYIMEVCLNFRADERTTFRAATRLEDGRVNFAYSVEGSDTVENTKVPAEFQLAIPVFDGPGQKVHRLVAKLRYRATGGQLVLWYELIQPDAVLEAAYLELMAQVRESFGKPVIYGVA